MKTRLESIATLTSFIVANLRFTLIFRNKKTKKENDYGSCKRSSTVLETARQRLAGLKSITPAPNFGPSLTLTGYETDMTSVSNLLDSYNEKLSALDSLQNELQTAEAALRDKNVRILAAAGAQYGPDSSEYEQAGGTRRSERKRSGPKTPKPKPPKP